MATGHLRRRPSLDPTALGVFSDDDLETLTGEMYPWLYKDARDQEDQPHTPVTDPRRPSTIFIAAALTSQILAYQRDLVRAFDRTISGLERLAGEDLHNRTGGYQAGDEQGGNLVDNAIAMFTAAAAARFPKAFATGQGLAVQVTGRSRLAESEVEGLIGGQLTRNEEFVRGSLFADVGRRFRDILRDPALPAADAAVAVNAMGEAMTSRVGMYALKLWGLGHVGFGQEMQASGKLIKWVLTSLHPCKDCPELARRGPYGALNPLPTYPGLGDTECRTNCLCILVQV